MNPTPTIRQTCTGRHAESSFWLEVETPKPCSVRISGATVQYGSEVRLRKESHVSSCFCHVSSCFQSQLQHNCAMAMIVGHDMSPVIGLKENMSVLFKWAISEGKLKTSENYWSQRMSRSRGGLSSPAQGASQAYPQKPTRQVPFGAHARSKTSTDISTMKLMGRRRSIEDDVRVGDTKLFYRFHNVLLL